MKQIKHSLVYILLLLAVLMLSACGKITETMIDGYYTAEMADFDSHGWKEILTIYVKESIIVSVDYEASNRSGFIKSWDMDYMREMNATDGIYPNKYVRLYSEALLNYQSPEKVQAITGATHSYDTFQKLATAALEHARDGNTNVAYVEIVETAE